MLTVETDVLVVGGGLAALRAAYDARAAGSHVTIAVKGKLGRSGSSAMTSAGYSTVLLPEDSPDLHFNDTISGGKQLNDARLVRIMVEEAPQRLQELVEFGGRLSMDGDEAVIHPSGDHTVRRTVVAQNHSGRDFTEPLAQLVTKMGCRVMERTAVLDVLVADGQVAGAVAINYDSTPTEMLLIRARAVILATGGAGRLFAVTLNPNDVTGDGYAMALRAGAGLRDMEFVQFYPWRCIIPFRNYRMPIQPSTFVLGARLLNADGERFMSAYDPVRHDATTRDIAARAIYDQIRFGKDVKGGVRLDVSALSAEDWARSNPRPHRYFRERGLNFKEEEMILSPEAHFFMGGVVIDENGESAVHGLFAVGETAGGVHGANRLDSNALPETQVFGARAGRRAASYASRPLADADPGLVRDWTLRRRQARDDGEESPAYNILRARLQDVLWHKLGIVRDAPRLRDGQSELSALHDELEALSPSSWRDLLAHQQLANSLLVAEACFAAAVTRQESRGAHFRLDYPDTDDAWRKVLHLHWDASANTLKISAQPV